MLTVLGVVLGFVISYRALSGYDRYYTGRTCWADIIKNSRVMARLIWYHVPPCRTPRTDEEQDFGKLKRPKEELAKVMAEKRSGLDLIEGFAVAVKHHLRGEAGIYYEDLYELVRPLHPESLTLHTTSHFVSVTNSSQYELDLSPVIQTPLDLSRNQKPSKDVASPSSQQPATSIYVPSFNAITSNNRHTRTNSNKWHVPLPPKPEIRTHKHRPKLPGTGGGANLPLEILRCLSEWLSVLEDRGTVPGGGMGGLMGCVAAFEDSLCTLEKILAVPLPYVHIKMALNFVIHSNLAPSRHTVWLYLFFLPFQLVKMFGWYSIPGVTIAAFIYLGFVAAGEELEQPFGYDANDLDLDFFCKEIIRVDISRVKRSPCLNAWFSRRWKERILKEEMRDEERWKRPLGIRKGIVDLGRSDEHQDLATTATDRVAAIPDVPGERVASTHIGRMRSKTITELVKGGALSGNGKGKAVGDESSDSDFDDSDDEISSSEDEDSEGDLVDDGGKTHQAEPPRNVAPV
ncbi:hypothetical protein V5O48_002747 [Marasmius crinis-equi]|uniref:Uncharacterized protein n=1 Tax=Marasmius crinis-equi TaxID=585013 RepID=A0ABR3FUU8_9AGAR